MSKNNLDAEEGIDFFNNDFFLKKEENQTQKEIKEQQKGNYFKSEEQQIENVSYENIINNKQYFYKFTLNEDDNKSESSNNTEEFKFSEADIQNNFLPENFENSNYQKSTKYQERKLSNDEANLNEMKEKFNLSNPNLPKVPSYPLQMANFDFFTPQISDNNMNQINSVPFPRDLFTMNGKSGWICNFCQNFNYKMRTLCNRCGKAQMMYRSLSIQSGGYNQGSKYFSQDISPIPYTNSYNNLNALNNRFVIANGENNMGNMNPNSSSCSNMKYSQSNLKKNEKDKKIKKGLKEREGDWICFRCKNLNFAFRDICNRCNLTKNENQLIHQGLSN